MNLYKLHARSHELKNHAEARYRVPAVAWGHIRLLTLEEQAAKLDLFVKDPSAAFSFYCEIQPSRYDMIGASREDIVKLISVEGLRKLEASFATSAKYSYLYAIHTRTKFSLGEPAIATDAKRSVLYAEKFDMRFPMAEDVIAKDPKWAYHYADRVLQKPFPKGEDAIATDADIAFKYAFYVLRNRFPKGEAVIDASEHANNYADLVKRKAKNEP